MVKGTEFGNCTSVIIGIHIHTQLSGKAEILIKILKTHFKEKMDHAMVSLLKSPITSMINSGCNMLDK